VAKNSLILILYYTIKLRTSLAVEWEEIHLHHFVIHGKLYGITQPGGIIFSDHATAIADPIFYFGVHWHIDRVFDEYKLILAERDIRPLDRRALMRSNELSTEAIQVPDEFTPNKFRNWRKQMH
jgi:hypothetical protein